MATSPTNPQVSDKHAKALQFIEEMTQNPDLVQKNVLAEILTRNAETEYLKGFNLDGATDPETFKSKIPIVDYDDLKPLIRRIVLGDRSPILCASPVSGLMMSTGTSGGQSKLFPSTKEDEDLRHVIRSLVMPVINLHVKGLDKGKALYFLYAGPATKTPSGLLTQYTLGRYYRSDNFKTRPDDPFNVYTSPREAILCEDTFQSSYAQMLCGLYERDQVLRIGMLFSWGLIQAVQFLQHNWQDLTHDIRTGSLNPKMTDPSIRECMTRIMRPDPDLANIIAKECEKDNWEGIISRIWPNTKYLDTVVTGSMAPSIPILDYYSGGLQIVSTIYASSECVFGFNLDPLCKPTEISYTLFPNMAFFEFLPHDQESDPTRLGDDPELINLADVKLGKEYELVITTYTGLYRYRMGDVLRVTGFHNSAPQFRFLKRKNVLLSIEADKTDEAELQSAVANASLLLEEFDTSVVEYTSHAYTSAVPGHYVIYWELFSKKGSDSLANEVLDQCCLAMEESLNWIYRQTRVEGGAIGPLEIRVVKSGTFQKLMEYAMSRGACINQYKVPRCVSSAPMLELLDSAIVSAHFSPSLPRWTPEPWGYIFDDKSTKHTCMS